VQLANGTGVTLTVLAEAGGGPLPSCIGNGGGSRVKTVHFSNIKGCYRQSPGSSPSLEAARGRYLVTVAPVAGTAVTNLVSTEESVMHHVLAELNA